MKSTLTIIGAVALLAIGTIPALARDNSRSGRDRDTDQNSQNRLIRADQLINAEIQDPQGRDLGTVEDVILNGDFTKASFLVVAMGRPGTGGEYKLVPWRAVEVSCSDQNEPAYRGRTARGHRDRGHEGDRGCAFVINAPESQLMSAYGFEPNQWPDLRNPAWYRQASRAWNIEPDREDVQNYRHGGPPERWLASHWPDTNTYVRYDGDLGRVDDLVLSPEGDVAFVLIGVGGRFRYRDVRTVAVPPTMIYATNTGIAVDAADPQELVQYAIGNDRDMAQLTTRFERSARGQRYGHDRTQQRDRGYHDRQYR